MQNLASESTNKELLEFVKTSCSRSAIAQKKSLTVGIEHEFFLFKQTGELADTADSISFFSSMATERGWISLNDGSNTPGVARQYSDRRFAKIKYEYPPHLLEVAFTYYDDLNALSDGFSEVWEQITRAALRSGLEVKHLPFLNRDLISKVTNLNHRPALDHSRLIAAGATKAGSPNREIAQFPLYTASTQIHIGGIRWWENAGVLTSLYEFESILWIYGSLLLSEDVGEAASIYKRRRDLYAKCFPNLSLVGIPDFESWTFDAWIDGLLRSPMVGGEMEPWAGRSFSDARPQNLEIKDLFLRFRDLQYVRPRIIGTIEFRGDPAVPSADLAVSLAAMRLGVSILSQKSTKIPFSAIRSRWQQSVDGGSIDESEYARTVSLVEETLASRKMSEEKYIRSFRTRNPATKPA